MVSVKDHLDWVAGEIDPDHIVREDGFTVRDDRCDWAASALTNGLHYYVGLSVNGFGSPKDRSYGRRYWVFKEGRKTKVYSSLHLADALRYLADQT